MFEIFGLSGSILWLLLFVVLLLIEILTLGLTTIWFAGGALVAYIAALAGANVLIQIVLFFIVSIVLLFFTRPLATKYLNKNRLKTNVDSLIGKTGLVKEPINNMNATGVVVVNGLEWTARTSDDAITIEEGKVVEVLEIQGVKAIVKEKEKETEE